MESGCCRHCTCVILPAPAEHQAFTFSELQSRFWHMLTGPVIATGPAERGAAGAAYITGPVRGGVPHLAAHRLVLRHPLHLVHAAQPRRQHRQCEPVWSTPTTSHHLSNVDILRMFATAVGACMSCHDFRKCSRHLMSLFSYFGKGNVANQLCSNLQACMGRCRMWWRAGPRLPCAARPAASSARGCAWRALSRIL